MRATQEGQTLHITLVRPARPRLQVVTDFLPGPTRKIRGCGLCEDITAMSGNHWILMEIACQTL